MIPLSRRSFLTKSAAAATGLVMLGQQSRAMLAPQNRHHPLDGIEPENIRITDVTVTPLSYVDNTLNLWRHLKYIVWKTDACLCRIYVQSCGYLAHGSGSPASEAITPPASLPGSATLCLPARVALMYALH